MRIQEDVVVPAQSQQYQNFIVRYNQNLHGDFDYQSDQNIEAAREYSSGRNNLPYILLGGAGLAIFLLLLWRIIKVAKS